MRRNLNSDLFRSDFLYQDEKSRATSLSLRELSQKQKDGWRWDPNFMELYLRGHDTWPRSPVADIRKIAAAPQDFLVKTRMPASQSVASPRRAPKTASPIADAFDFVESLHRSFPIEGRGPVAIALSGGLDSQVIALYAQSKSFTVNAYYLETGIPGYCEKKAVENFCERWKINCHPIKSDAHDFLQSLSGFLAATECPIYNLHPVSKWILARELAALGVQTVYSGDGADQTFANVATCDLFFLTKSCFGHFGIDLITPLANLPLQVWAKKMGPFANKEPLRRWAQTTWALDTGPKRSGLFPDIFPAQNCFETSLELLKEILCAP